MIIYIPRSFGANGGARERLREVDAGDAADDRGVRGNHTYYTRLSRSAMFVPRKGNCHIE